jgi:hypothetical protein
MKNLNEILKNSNQYLKEGNFKMASVEVSKGIENCGLYHRQLNEEINLNWDMKKQWDFKQEYQVCGKRLQYWSEKFWTLLEDNNLDLVLMNKPEIEPLTKILTNDGGEEVEFEY